MVLHLRTGAPRLWEGAKCLSIEVTQVYDPFFGWEMEGDGTLRDETEVMDESRAMCNGTEDGVVCPLRHECLIFALTNNLKEGIWGGTTPLDRKAIRKQWPLKSGKVPRPEWHWFPEGEPVSWYGAAIVQAELDAEYDEDEDDEL
jgi:hypothetical protein